MKSAGWIALGMLGIKLWLVQGLSLSAYNYLYDDRLYLNLADAILKGQWLGPYSVATLMKEPGYPLWIAGSFLAGVPLLFGQHILYFFSCCLLIYLLRPFVRWQALLVVAFILLLFEPSSYSPRLLRLTREGIYSSLTILLFACSLAMILHRCSGMRRQAVWSSSLGCVLSYFWVTREEGIWMLPSLLLLAGYYLSASRKTHAVWKRVVIVLLPAAILGLSLTALSVVNYSHYGVFDTIELKSPPFKRAVGALTRVTHQDWHRFIPVPKATREKIYHVSPAFREVQPFLEGELGRNWAALSASRMPPEESIDGDIGGGWFLWALRESVARAGHHSDAREAANYYNRLAAEVNTACETGPLDCGPGRVSTVSPWRSELLPYIWKAFTANLEILLSFRENEPVLAASIVDIPGYILFTDITRETVAPPKGEKLPTSHQNAINAKKLQILGKIFLFYTTAVKYLFWGAVLCLLANIAYSLKNRGVPAMLLFSLSILTAILCRLALLAYVAATSFPSYPYLTPLYPLVLLFPLVVFVNLYQNLATSNPINGEQRTG